MINIEKIRQTKGNIVTIGSYPGIIQSILDFDYLVGKKEPSISLIIASGRNYERYFWGKKEILIPVVSSFKDLPDEKKQNLSFFINLSSARRVLSSTKEILESLPSLLGGVIFAENVPEKHSLELYEFSKNKNKFIIGPSSVGLVIPEVLKLGPIGGIDVRQLIDSSLLSSGSVAVFSASGGMTGELIRIVANSGKNISFSLSFGGDRFPITTPSDAFMSAQNDSKTKAIVYFGELGGVDEYEIADLIKTKKITKPTFCFIAGSISEIFETPPQFGHAKAMAKNQNETARAKKEALKNAGATVYETFPEFVRQITNAPLERVKTTTDYSRIRSMEQRKKALISTTISKDEDGNVKILNEDLLKFAKQNSFAAIVASLFLGKKIKSRQLEDFVDFVLRLLVDHGPYVSGALNTIVASRAGRDLVSSLSSGLLTIGSRFGGAINQAADNWLKGVTEGWNAADFVEHFVRQKIYISGIGHKKYRLDMPDPRVSEILNFSHKLSKKRFSGFAKEVEKVTTGKKANLILNVDGAIAAVLLDILSEKEGYSDKDLGELIDTEFFNALFVISRSVGFIAHFLDQKRLDEGLLRLDEDMVSAIEVKD
ncbi:MAG: hypothetical protein HY344_02730 [Candidatus Levybacteria bacterium]|nr:hypothetical protein [Candidatus Levybacteria bacterium]